MFMVDRERSVAIVRNGGVVTRHLRFDGKILAGLRVIFWGNIEAKDVYLGKGCVVMGRITCDRAVIGACTRFNEIFADEVLIQGRCLGRYVKARNVHIAEGCVIGEVEADEKIVIDGNSKLGKLNAKKILASSEGGGGET
ncbi:MAG: hypothetical protein DRP01_07790 [Archaeoglobales archaeon]|nr:MAG: hypothetical protein DRP01_07790 [Archaeoglobales archaeon]